MYVLFEVAYPRIGEWKSAVILKVTYIRSPSSRSYIILALSIENEKF